MDDKASIITSEPVGSDLIGALFDRVYYLSRYIDVEESGADPLGHFLTEGRFEGRSPHPLFDTRHYLAQLRGTPKPSDPVGHYLSTGHASGLSPHPLFDHAHYASQFDGELDRPALIHYLQVGARRGVSPHPLFDPEYYLLSGGIETGPRDPLSHYLLQDKFNFAPHYLFSDAVYVAELHKIVGEHGSDSYRDGPPLLHYVSLGHRFEPKTHPLFDPGYYRASLQKTLDRRPDERVERGLADAKDLLSHYVDVGVRFAISPSALFDLDYYVRQAGGIDGDPLRHYLMPEGFSRYSPHPAIDLDYYARRAGFLSSDVPCVLHMLSTPQAQRISPHPAFDAVRYKRIYDDIGKAGVCPILHFIEHGMREDRSPNEWFSIEYVYAQNPRYDFRNESAVHFYFAGDMAKRTRLVFVSHDAGLTGAPGTVLRLTEDLADYSNVECFVVVARHGPRIREFQRTAHTIVLNTPFYSAPREQLRSAVRHLMELTEGNNPVAALVNSAESRAIAPELARAGIPVVTLVHEAADLYPQGAFDSIVESSKSIVFGSQYVLDRARSVLIMQDGLAMVRGQGLQQDYVGTMSRSAARAMVVDELKLDDDVFLVLGCGSIDYRKGADLFVASALDFLRRHDDLPSGATFIWVGQSDGSILQSFINNAIRSEGRDIDIRFIGARDDVEPYFVAADAFLMTSRVDPFPCVCQEAMASGLPIVAFAEGGGTIEMIGTDAGFCVPLGDTVAMSDSLYKLASDPALRQTLGQRGRAIVRDRWRPRDYAAFVAGKLAEVSGIDAEQFGRAPDVREAGARALFLFDNWEPSAFNRHIEEIVDGLRQTGVDAEILLTRGRFTPGNEGAAVPNAKHRFLSPGSIGYSDGRWRTSAEEVWRELRQLARNEQPCVLFVADDALATALAPLLPSSIAIVPLLANSDPGSIETHYRIGPKVDAIIAVAEAGALDLIAQNPALKSKVNLIEPNANLRRHENRAHRNVIFVHADPTQKSVRTMILDLLQRLKQKGLDYHLVVGATLTDAKQSRRSVAASLGVAADDLLVGHSAETDGLLCQAQFVILMDSDASALALLPKAVGAGATVIAVGPSPTLSRALAGGAAGIPVRVGAKAIADLIGRLGADVDENRARQALAQDWLSREGRSLEAEVVKYRELVERLTSGLMEVGSSRPLDLPHLADQRFVWPASMQRIGLNEVRLPSPQ